MPRVLETTGHVDRDADRIGDVFSVIEKITAVADDVAIPFQADFLLGLAVDIAAHFDNVNARLLQAPADVQRLFKGQAAFKEIGTGNLDPNGKMRSRSLTNGRDDIADDAVAIGRRTAIGVAAPIVIRTEELVEQIRMATVDFNGIEATVTDALGCLGVFADEVLDISRTHGDANGSRLAFWHGGRREDSPPFPFKGRLSSAIGNLHHDFCPISMDAPRQFLILRDKGIIINTHHAGVGPIFFINAGIARTNQADFVLSQLIVDAVLFFRHIALSIGQSFPRRTAKNTVAHGHPGDDSMFQQFHI